MTAAYNGNRRFGRSKHAHVIVGRRGFGKCAAIGFGGVPFVCRDDEPGQPPKWRIARPLALFDLIFVKRFAIAGDERAHHRMLRLMRLQVAETAPLLSPGAPDHLMQQLECALRGTRVAVSQAKVGIDDTDQIKLRKMMPFGDKLRADNKIEASFGNIVELLPQPVDRFHEIARQHENAGLWKQFSRLVREPFHAGPDGSKTFGSMAIWAFRRRRNRISAVMAHEPALEPMIDQPSITVRTLEPEPARPTQRER